MASRRNLEVNKSKTIHRAHASSIAWLAAIVRSKRELAGLSCHVSARSAGEKLGE
jgi:hypothetical protein